MHNDPTSATFQVNQPGRFFKSLKRAAVRLLIVTALGYVSILGLLVAGESRLVYPGALPDSRDYAKQPEDVEEVWIESFDGTRLHAWLLKTQQPQRRILFCHGNAENVATVSSRTGRRLREELQAEVLLVDYRGYGKTGGQPDEQSVVRDCEAAQNWFAARSRLSPAEITLYGRSLGGGIAVQLASKLGARELILDRTFDSLVSPAAERFPWIPVRLLMRNRFSSDQWMAACRMPVFQSHFTTDELIPIESARALFARVVHPESEFLGLSGGTHLMPLPDAYWPALREFIERVDRAAEKTGQ